MKAKVNAIAAAVIGAASDSAAKLVKGNAKKGPAAASAAEVAELTALQPIAITPAQFVAKFKASLDAEGTQQGIWVELALQAPLAFGEYCYVRKAYEVTENGKTRFEPHEDYLAMRSHLEAAYDMPDAPEKGDKSDLANEKRERRNTIQRMLSVYFRRMESYAMPKPESESAAPTLEQWAKRALVQVAGKPEIKDGKTGKIKQRAVKAQISGAAPTDLLAILKRLAGIDAEPVRVALPNIIPASTRRTIKAEAATA